MTETPSEEGVARRGWLRSPVTWIAVAVGAFGLLTGFRSGFGAMAAVYVAPTVEATALLLVTGAIGWYLARRLQPGTRPPRGRCLAVLLWGMTAADGCAILANRGLTAVLSRTLGPAFTERWGPPIVAPVNEELLKLAGLVLLVVASRRYVRRPVDGYVLGALVGLGFQVAENWHYALNAVEVWGGVDGGAAVGWSFQERVIPAAVGSHWALSAVVGTGFAVLLTRRGPFARVATGVGLILLGMAMHAAFDLPLSHGARVGVSLATLVIALAIYLALRLGARRAARVVLPDWTTPTRAEPGPVESGAPEVTGSA